MKHIVTLTLNPTIDKSSSIDTVAPEIKMRCDEPTFDPGGGGINVSRAIKTLGGTTHAVYLSGGFSGQMLTSLLEADGIDQHPIAIDGLTRENLTIYERSSTQQYRFGMPGPTVSYEEARTALDAALALKPDYLVASGSLPPGVNHDFYADVARQAAAAGAKTIVDTSGKALDAAVRAGVYLFKPNLGELEVFSNTKIESHDHLRDIARQLIGDGMTEVVVVSMGAAGAAYVTANDFKLIRAPLVPIQSKVGAGDSMVGGMVLALARGDSPLDAARYGVAAGTAAVMTTGTQLCHRDDVERLFGEVSVA